MELGFKADEAKQVVLQTLRGAIELLTSTGLHPEAAIVKHTGRAVNNENADLFMAYDAAIPLFRVFIEVCKNNNN